MKHINNFESYLILENILSSIPLNESIEKEVSKSTFSKVLDKVKEYSKKGLVTAALLTSLLGSANFTQAQESELRQVSKIENQVVNNLEKFWNSLGNDIKSKINIIVDNLSENFERMPGVSFDYMLVKSLENGKLSISDLDKIEKLNTDDFYTSTSTIKQNAITDLKNKLNQSGVKVDNDLIIFKKLDNGNYRAYYLIPKKN
jgi:RNAse (barnase) inhibitor barstar